MPQDDELSVSEGSEYRANTKGPTTDTQAFHHATPAPGERRVFDGGEPPPPERSKARNSSGGLPKIPIQRTATLEPESSIDVGIPAPLLAAGLGMLGFALFSATLVIVLVWGNNSEPPPEPPPVDEVEGIPVHKGLKRGNQ